MFVIICKINWFPFFFLLHTVPDSLEGATVPFKVPRHAVGRSDWKADRWLSACKCCHFPAQAWSRELERRRKAGPVPPGTDWQRVLHSSKFGVYTQAHWGLSLTHLVSQRSRWIPSEKTCFKRGKGNLKGSPLSGFVWLAFLPPLLSGK